MTLKIETATRLERSNKRPKITTRRFFLSEDHTIIDMGRFSIEVSDKKGEGLLEFNMPIALETNRGKVTVEKIKLTKPQQFFRYQVTESQPDQSATKTIQCRIRKINS